MNTALKRTSLPWTLTATGLGTIIACSGHTLDAGRNDREGRGGSSSIDGGDLGYGGEPFRYWWILTPPSHSYRDGCAASVTSGFNGTWRGTFDDYTISSGSRSVRLVVEAGTVGGICGSITFGGGEPPPLPTDREAPYAPGLEGQSLVTSDSREQTLVDGFVYQFGMGQPVKLDLPAQTRQRTRINLRQPYKAWCEIQYSYPVETNSQWWESSYSCLPPYTSADPNSCEVDGVPTSCTQVDLCILEPFCNCSTVGCTLLDNIGPDPLRAPPSTGVQLEFAGESAFGTIPLADGIHAFTLTRSAE